jgi:hypothetical protein
VKFHLAARPACPSTCTPWPLLHRFSCARLFLKTSYGDTTVYSGTVNAFICSIKSPNLRLKYLFHSRPYSCQTSLSFIPVSNPNPRTILSRHKRLRDILMMSEQMRPADSRFNQAPTFISTYASSSWRFRHDMLYCFVPLPILDSTIAEYQCQQSEPSHISHPRHSECKMGLIKLVSRQC